MAPCVSLIGLLRAFTQGFFEVCLLKIMEYSHGDYEVTLLEWMEKLTKDEEAQRLLLARYFYNGIKYFFVSLPCCAKNRYLLKPVKRSILETGGLKRFFNHCIDYSD
jgi:hypothetical protein